MARINVEDNWWSDARRMKLIELLNGNSRLADGLMLQAWKLGQNHCEQGVIPLSQFLCLSDSELLFECDLVVLIQANSKQTPSKAKQTISNAKQDEAILSKCQVYVRGAKEHHDWLAKRRGAAKKGGIKSAQRDRDETGQLQANSKQNESNTSKHDQNQPSSSCSPSSSPSRSKKNKLVGIRMEYPSDFDEIWGLYQGKGDKKTAYEKFQGLQLDSTEDLKKAIANYVLKNPELKYRKDLERFLEMDWRPLINVDPGTNGVHPKTQKRLDVLNSYISKVETSENGGNNELKD